MHHCSSLLYTNNEFTVLMVSLPNFNSYKMGDNGAKIAFPLFVIS